MKYDIREEFRGWKLREIVWLVSESILILALSLYLRDSVIGILSGLTGIICVICTGKGKLMSFLFGICNVIMYSIISCRAGLYGELMLNVIYYLPMQCYGLYVWSRNMDTVTHEVRKRRMNTKSVIITIAIIIPATALYGIFLRRTGGIMPFADAFSTVISAVTLMISVNMYIEQWILWFAADSINLVMWLIVFVSDKSNGATVIMWGTYLVNAVIMYCRWDKEIKKNERRSA